MELKTTNIKGKDYVEVNQRVKAFRSLEAYKGWSIESEFINLNDDSCVIKTIIKDETGRVISTGFAQEDRTSSMINKTSFVENCETSAVGRALGILGIGVDCAICSAEEVDMAIKKQENSKPQKKQETKTTISANKNAMLLELGRYYTSNDNSKQAILNYCTNVNVSSPKELTEEQIGSLLRMLGGNC